MPLALFVILAGVLLDSVTRLFLTFSSSYFRLIDLPAASYGLIWAGLGALGFVVSPVARRMVQRGSPARKLLLGRDCYPDVPGRTGAALAMVGRDIHLPAWRVHGRDRLFSLVLSERPGRVEPARHGPFFQGRRLQSRLRIGKPALCLSAARPARRREPEETFGRTLIWLPLWLALALVMLAIVFPSACRRCCGSPGGRQRRLGNSALNSQNQWNLFQAKPTREFLVWATPNQNNHESFEAARHSLSVARLNQGPPHPTRPSKRTYLRQNWVPI